ncbi:Riboflavin kinase / FMN adenylyltransferase [Streptococcus sp. DD10]|nr:Riboflavin kinase / FMN adenylyltransferase [Streptococcus sp. DD10]
MLVLGYFDGLHLGHQELFRRAREIAERDHLQVAVLTFPESPKLTFVRYQPELLLHLLSPEKRMEELEDLGVEVLYLTDFTSDFASYNGKEFIQRYVKKLRAKVLVAGFDYSFGSDKRDVKTLETDFDGEVVIVSSINLGEEKVSSTRIRQAIRLGDVKLAGQLLGRPLSSRGIVVHGDARGRTIGYPTANLAPLDMTHLPADGVYVVEVEFEGKFYRGMASVGKNITFEGKELRFEVNIFDFSRDIYGHTITIHWLDKIRNMVKFDSVEGLVEQLESDETQARAWKNC